MVAGDTRPSTGTSSRLLLSCYWITTVTLAAVFTGNLVAFMTIQKPTIPIKSLEDLVEHPEYRAGVYARGSTEEYFKVRSRKD